MNKIQLFCSLFLFFSLSISFINSQNLNFTGTWTTELDAAASFYICQNGSTGILQGMYAEYGFVWAIVNGTTANGNWWQAGTEDTDITGDCCIANWGTFRWDLSSTGTTFSGAYTFSDPTYGGQSWGGSLMSASPPQFSQCFGSTEPTGVTLEGQWTIGTSGTWDICIADDDSFTSSYTYNSGGSTVNGYITGLCFLNGQLCQGEWYESSSNWGIYLIRLSDTNSLLGTWWSGAPYNWDYSNVGDPTQHGLDSQIRISSTPSSCSRNSNLYYQVYYNALEGELSPGAIAGIVIGCAVFVAIVFFIICCCCCRFARRSTGVIYIRRHGWGRSYGGGWGG